MTITYSILGQVAPTAATVTDAYTVGTGKQAIISSIVIANQASSATSFRIAVRKNGEALSTKQYLAYDVVLAGNDSLTMTLGITLGAGDIITVYNTLATMSFNIFGNEIS